MISARGGVGISVMINLCQHVLHGKRMPGKCQTSVLVPIFKAKGNVKNCNAYRKEKLLERAIKIVDRVPERRIRELVCVDAMQFCFMPGRGTISRIVCRNKKATRI